jgi:hypothetical protein
MLEYENYGDFGLDAPGAEIPAQDLLNSPSSYGACVFQEQICLRQNRLAGLSRSDQVQALQDEIASLTAAAPTE